MLYEIKKIFHSFPTCCSVDIYILVRLATHMSSCFSLFALTIERRPNTFIWFFTHIMIYFLLYFIYTHTQRFNQILDFYRFDWTLSRFALLYGTIEPYKRSSRKVESYQTLYLHADLAILKESTDHQYWIQSKESINYQYWTSPVRSEPNIWISRFDK